MRRNPKERPSASKLLRHPWFADLIPRGMAAPLTNISVDADAAPRVRIVNAPQLPLFSSVWGN